MAERYEDRYRSEEYRGERGYGRDRDDRGFFDRAGDEVRSWFGDEEAERRRRMDERERERQERSYGRDYGSRYDYDQGSERGWSEPYRPERGRGSERWRGGEGSRSGVSSTYGGADYDRWSGGYADPYGGYGRYGTASSTRSYQERQSSETTRRGQFFGRGPKGYHRSDARINEDVCDRLTDAPDIDASNVEVRVANGEVTLSGTVFDRNEKHRAEDLIENVSGVREVHNNLRVSRGNESTIGTGTTAPSPTTRR
jgi:osmotically-inducible protein OsmY